jgi:ATP-binding cassette, subfamily B, bacterial
VKPPTNVPAELLERRYHGAHPLRMLWEFLGEDRARLAWAAVFQVVKHSPVWVLPLVVANVVDALAKPADRGRALALNLGVLALVILQNVPMHMVFMRLLSTSARNLERHLRSAVCRRLQHLSIGYYARTRSGALQSKLLRDVESIQQLLMGVFEPVLMFSAAGLAALVITALRVPVFLLLYVLIVPLAVVAVTSLRRPIRDRNAELRREVEQLSSSLTEMTELIPITRAHGEEQHELARVEQRLAAVQSAGLRLDRITAVFGSAAWVLLQLFGALTLGAAAVLFITQWVHVRLGDVVLLTGYFTALVGAVLGLLNLVPQVTRGFEALRSVGEVLECPDLEENEGKLAVSAVRGRFAFEHVGHRYPASSEEALRSIELIIEEGETVAFVGPSGAGKSTLLNMVIGFLRPTSGRILLDGRDMAALDLRTYRRFLSVVPQDTILFAGTILENVAYGTRAVDEGRVRRALEDAQALEFVEQLPDGWRTLVGEHGARLSGGEKQRLAIARALVRDPRVLVLDEATSSLDAASEALIQPALARLMRGRTTFVVAHRLSTVRNASRIVVMEAGRIVEIGTHAGLLEAGGRYSRLYGLQFGSEAVEPEGIPG